MQQDGHYTDKKRNSNCTYNLNFKYLFTWGITYLIVVVKNWFLKYAYNLNLVFITIYVLKIESLMKKLKIIFIAYKYFKHVKSNTKQNVDTSYDML